MDWLSEVPNLLSFAMQSQVAQFGTAFSIAAWIHSGRVKKEISTQMKDVVSAINNTALALRQDLTAQNKRIDSLEDGLIKIKDKVIKLGGKNADS